MTTALRTWWRNCALESDTEILAIDSLEDALAPITTDTAGVRELISTLELCHHKADRWVWNIIEAIGTGKSSKGLGTRTFGQRHPVETIWQNACTALSAWCAGCPIHKSNLTVDEVPVSRLLGHLREHTPLKIWQVQRVIDKIRSTIRWSQSDAKSSAPYQWLLLSGGDYGTAYRDTCPERFKEQEPYWLKTVRTFIQDTETGEEADLSLALAIDMLMPCHWAFADNLEIVLSAIGGQLRPAKPFAACGRNIGRVPIRSEMEIVSDTLQFFCGNPDSDRQVDQKLLVLLGHATPVKTWLAASLEKTIRLQMNPPDDLRTLSALAGPDWIKS